MKSLAALVLAAGEGKRFGQPKALAFLEGKTFLQIAVETVRDGGIEQISIVLGAEAQEIGSHPAVIRMFADSARAGAVISISVNEDWRSGRTGSIIMGLKAVPPRMEGALLHQVDFPYIASTTIGLLAEAFALTPERTDSIFLPVHGGRRGHPIIIGQSYWPAIEAMGPDDPLRELIHSDIARVIEVPVPDPGIHRNVNEAGDAAGRKGD